MAMKNQLAKWRRDPASFMTQALIDPQTGGRFELFEAERIFLDRAFRPNADGDLPYKDILWSCIKKSGKSTFGALCMLYTVICLGGRFAEAYVIANDYDQSQSRIFTATARIVEASPLLRARITADRITFSNGSFIQALASDYRGAAGIEPVFVIADELWGFTSESSQRLYEECCPTPTRHPSVRMIVSYAGFTGESVLLENLVNRGKAGEQIAKDLYAQPGMIAFISHERIAPWQSEKWLEEARQSTRPSAFLRQYCNEFTSGESTFIDMAWWDNCIDAELTPELADPRLSVWVGVDASVKRDSTAIVACTFDRELKKVRLVSHRIFQPSPDDPLDFEATVETELITLRRRFNVCEIKYDPYQLVSVAQRLTANGLPMVEFPQSVPNLTAASTNLFELIKGRNLIVYPDDQMRLAISRCVAVETTRGWKIAKEKASAKIDVIVALAQAALGAVQQSTSGDGAIRPGEILLMPTSRWSARWAGNAASESFAARIAREDARPEPDRVFHGSRFDLFKPASGWRFGGGRRGIW